jgi:ATP-dependent Clp protease adaptor protein ClpS
MDFVRSAGEWRLGGPNEPPGGPPQQPPRRDDGQGGDDGRTGALTLTRTRTKKPSMYKVLMLNDDYTPMEFVVDWCCRDVFQTESREDATQHHAARPSDQGVGVCGVYTIRGGRDQGDSDVMDAARKNQHPLQCT